RGLLELALEMVDAGPVALGERAKVRRVGDHALGESVSQLRRKLAAGPRRVAGEQLGGLDPVDDQTAERHAVAAQLVAKEDRLLDRLALGRADDQKRRLPVAQQRTDGVGLLAHTI